MNHAENVSRTCAVDGCFGIAENGLMICEDHIQGEIDAIKGIRTILPKKHDKLINFLWRMLPKSSECPDRKLTAFGYQTKDNLREIICIIDAANYEHDHMQAKSITDK